MTAVLALLRPLEWLNATLLRLGRWIGIACVALMVVAILVQVIFRYVLNNALPWPDEAARFLMLWMTGLMAPGAYRNGGFVAIDMLSEMLPKAVAATLQLLLLGVAMAVLVMALQLGLKHVDGGWLFNSSSLKLPLDLFGGKVVRLKLAWMYMSLFVGVVLLTLVNVELILRSLVTLAGGADRLRPLGQVELGAE